MYRVLILGLGYIGTKLKNYLKNNGVDVTAFSQKDFDYTCEENLLKHIAASSYDYVINCSGYTGRPNVDGCEIHKPECWYYNVVVGSLINQVCSKLGVKHICVSSGCIYTGYDRDYTENDTPNFGLYNNESSFYSKSKHALETLFNYDCSAILRIRMPFDANIEDKNYLIKILRYNNLISYDNSLTNIDDLCKFISLFLSKFEPGIFNVANPQRANAQQIVEIFKSKNLTNSNWKFVDLDKLNIVASRSNCVLNTDKIKNLGLELRPTQAALDETISKIAEKML